MGVHTSLQVEVEGEDLKRLLILTMIPNTQNPSSQLVFNPWMIRIINLAPPPIMTKYDKRMYITKPGNTKKSKIKRWEDLSLSLYEVTLVRVSAMLEYNRDLLQWQRLQLGAHRKGY